jgi:hypothetical protein
MKAKLIKTDKGNYILIDPTKGVYDKGYHLGNSRECDVPKLSKQNCDDIFGVVDVEKLAEYSVQEITESNTEFYLRDVYKEFFKDGFDKAMELNKDKVFTLDDVKKAIQFGLDGIYISEDRMYEYEDGTTENQIKRFIQSLQQPTEMDVEIEMICPHPMDTYRCGLQYGCDGDGCNHPNQIPYLDSEGCLILKKI